ncbi:hypothetical protein [Leucobacter chromiisoli]|uniref:hypothetical protein n=1 Tax=Leucobacter chromiisoli TaxID=2796471 RepID=UPI0027DB3110|nr:hypothetical protein [Leucobacter chromiisoli]
MTRSRSRPRALRVVLIVLLVLASAALLGAVAVLLPILTHQSAGGSGQRLPEEYVAHAAAEGADGRTRELRVETPEGTPADLSELRPGDELIVRGSGFDASIGIYVGVCAVPEDRGNKPSPCLGGIPEGAEEGHADRAALSSVWITDDWAWRAFATHGYDDAESGAFTAQLTVPASSQGGLDCSVVSCAVTTRSDHTAGSDRVQDMQLPVRFAENPQ